MSQSRRPANLTTTITRISRDLAGKQYAIRGTASLVLQGIDMNVDDIDIICDRETALYANEVWAKYLVKPVSHSITNQYSSYFGEFEIQGIKVEIMGEWQIFKDGKSSKIFDGQKDQITYVSGIKVTTIETELEMFIWMGRFNAFNKIKRLLKTRRTHTQNLVLE